jgi:hypothetical protein
MRVKNRRWGRDNALLRFRQPFSYSSFLVPIDGERTRSSDLACFTYVSFVPHSPPCACSSVPCCSLLCSTWPSCSASISICGQHSVAVLGTHRTAACAWPSAASGTQRHSTRHGGNHCTRPSSPCHASCDRARWLLVARNSFVPLMQSLVASSHVPLLVMRQHDLDPVEVDQRFLVSPLLEVQIPQWQQHRPVPFVLLQAQLVHDDRASAMALRAAGKVFNPACTRHSPCNVFACSMERGP